MERSTPEETPKDPSRRNFLSNLTKTIVSSSAVGALSWKIYNTINNEEPAADEMNEDMSSLSQSPETIATEREPIDWRKLHQRPDLPIYAEIVPEPELKNLSIDGKVFANQFELDDPKATNTFSRLESKVVMTLRFKPIVEAVADRYNIDPDLLSAVIMQESTGRDLLPNSSNDGGAGIAHMQPSTTHEFGGILSPSCKTSITGSDGKIRTDYPTKSEEAGKNIRKLMIDYRDDRAFLSKTDDRLNPLANIDLVARMISSWFSDPFVARHEEYKGMPAIERGIKRYCGPGNWPKYFDRVCAYARLLKDPNAIDTARQRFNAANPELLINNEKADFDKLIQVYNQYHETNCNVEGYKKHLPLLRPQNSHAANMQFEISVKEAKDLSFLWENLTSSATRLIK